MSFACYTWGCLPTFLPGNWRQDVHSLSEAQVQDLSGQRGVFVQGHRPQGEAACAQMVLQGCEAADPRGHRDQRGCLRQALRRNKMDRVRLLPGREGQGGEGQSWGCWGGEILIVTQMTADGTSVVSFLSPLISSKWLHDDCMERFSDYLMTCI